jgi:hypothetical protein
MTTLARRLPLSLDPLIEEARRRMRRRRVLGALLLLAVAATVGIAVTASRSPGGPQSAGSSHGKQAQQSSSNRLPVNVPLDSTERQWRAWVVSHEFGIKAGPRADVASLQGRVESAVAASGASIVRLSLWQGDFEQPPVELVVAAPNPALYLRHRLDAVLQRFDHGYLYVQLVDRRGAKILEWTLRATRAPSTLSRRFSAAVRSRPSASSARRPPAR